MVERGQCRSVGEHPTRENTDWRFFLAIVDLHKSRAFGGSRRYARIAGAYVDSHSLKKSFAFNVDGQALPLAGELVEGAKLSGYADDCGNSFNRIAAIRIVKYWIALADGCRREGPGALSRGAPEARSAHKPRHVE